MFIWAKIPNKYKTSLYFVNDLFNQTEILFIPGSSFGSYGEGFVRITLIQDIQTIEKAFLLIKKIYLSKKRRFKKSPIVFKSSFIFEIILL